MVIYLDPSKAFDRVNHQLLMKRFGEAGFTNTVYEWLGSYMTNRAEYAKVRSATSEMGTIVNGIPQGSVLGALLFLIYINGLCLLDINGEIVSYADDTAKVFNACTMKYLVDKAEKEIQRVVAWLDENGMSLNAT